MDPVLAFITQPPVLILIAILVFIGRVMYLARHLRSAARSPTFADLRALEEAKKSLDAHHESIEAARGTLRNSLGASRDTLRHYKGPYANSIETRRKGLGDAMSGLETFKAPLEKAQEDQKTAYKAGLKKAKAIYKQSIPRKPRQAREGAPKDI